jgi:hypothetical protein
VSTQSFTPESVFAPVMGDRTEIKGLRPDFKVIQPTTTYTGAPIEPIQKGLPKITQSLCPECGKVIRADIFSDTGKVVMEKNCAEHGTFRDIVFSDVALYLKMEHWVFGDNRGLSNPAIANATDIYIRAFHRFSPKAVADLAAGRVVQFSGGEPTAVARDPIDGT